VFDWINLHSSQLKCTHNLSIIDVTWRHVLGKINPADIVSCGCAAAVLSDTIWLSGPKFLTSDPECWPQSPPDCKFDDLLEKRKAVSFACSSTGSADNKTKIANDQHFVSVLLEIVFRVGSYRRILKVPVHVLRSRRIRPHRTETGLHTHRCCNPKRSPRIKKSRIQLLEDSRLTCQGLKSDHSPFYE